MLKKTRKLRIAVLLVVLFIVALNTWLSQLRTTDWDSPLWVSIHPINGDGSPNTARYIATLTEEDFDEIEVFFSEEAQHYGLTLKQPVDFKLAGEVEAQPPHAPTNGSVIESSPGVCNYAIGHGNTTTSTAPPTCRCMWSTMTHKSTRVSPTPQHYRKA